MKKLKQSVVITIGIAMILQACGGVTRSKLSAVSEAELLFFQFKMEIMTFYADTGEFPTTLQQIPGLMTQGTYVTNMVYTHDAQHPQVVMTIDGFETGANQIGWKLTGRNWTCKAGENSGLTTIPSEYLSKICKRGNKSLIGYE